MLYALLAYCLWGVVGGLVVLVLDERPTDSRAKRLLVAIARAPIALLVLALCCLLHAAAYYRNLA